MRNVCKTKRKTHKCKWHCKYGVAKFNQRKIVFDAPPYHLSCTDFVFANTQIKEILEYCQTNAHLLLYLQKQLPAMYWHELQFLFSVCQIFRRCCTPLPLLHRYRV